MKTKIYLLFSMLLVAFMLQAQVLGKRQKLDINALKPGSYYPGVIYIKLKPGYENIAGKLPKKKTLKSSKTGYPSLDAVSKKTKTIKLSRSFEQTLTDETKAAKHSSTGLNRWITVQLPADANIAEALKAYASMVEVELAEPSYKRQLFDSGQPVTLWTPNDSAYNRQWNFNHTAQQGATTPAGIDADIDLPEAWDIERGKPQVIVAVMDAGVDTSHPDLRPNLWISGSNRFGYNWNTNSTQLQADKHGTHVAGILGAINNNSIGVSGIAGGDGTAGSGIRIMNMQIFDPAGNYAGDEAVANAFVFAADKGASVAQNSWGGGDYSTIVTDAIDYFIMQGGGNQLNGGIVFFAAGNNGTNAEQFPANYPPVIAVAATGYSDNKASYSQYGSWVDLSAPGGEGSGNKQILSTIDGKAYGWLRGTSMACPHASGVAALCISKAPGILTNSQLRNLLLSTADNIETLNPDYTAQLGTGRLNAFKALQATSLAAAPSISPVKTFLLAQDCGTTTISWTKNSELNNVIIAQSDTLLFGQPAGNLLVGDILAGGGKIMYKGSATSFQASIPPNQRRYFSIWSYSGNAYSFPKTASAIHQTTIDTLKVQNNSACNIGLSWADNLICSGDSVLLLVNNQNNFGVPTGVLAAGTLLPGGGKVIFKGKTGVFNYVSDLDSNVYFQKWNFGESHEYVNPFADLVTYVAKPNAIASLTANALNASEIIINWQAAANNCFAGTQFLLAYSQNGVFGEPVGGYSAGDSIIGGGRIIYLGSNTHFNQTGLPENTGYCYKIWNVKNSNQYSFGKQACTSTLCASGALQLPFSDNFEGKNLGTPDPCTWQIINNTKVADALKMVTSSGFPTTLPVKGSSMLRFYSYEVQADETVQLNSTAINKGANTSMDIRFRWYQDSSGFTDADYNGEGVWVQWSTDRSNWQHLEFYSRVPVQGQTGWSYKQLTLPAAAKNIETVFVGFLFVSKYGHNCYFDDLSFKISSFKPSDATTALAVCESTDSTSLWTNYYDSSGSRLLSIKKNGQDIGKAGQTGFEVKLGPTGASAIASSNNYMSNPGGFICSNRYYSLKPINDPTSKTSLRYYYATQDFNAVAALATSLNPSRLNISHGDLYGWKVNDLNGAYNVNPAGGHAGIPKATGFAANGFAQFALGSQPDTTTWSYSDLGNGMYQLEYVVKHLGGGGMGIGSISGKGAFQMVTYTFTGNGNWSNAANWAGGNKPPVILPNNGLISINPAAGGTCTLDVPQTVPAGASLQVQPGKTLIIKNALQLKN